MPQLVPFYGHVTRRLRKSAEHARQAEIAPRWPACLAMLLFLASECVLAQKLKLSKRNQPPRTKSEIQNGKRSCRRGTRFLVCEAIELQAVCVLRHQHMNQEHRASESTLDRSGRCRSFIYPLALVADEIWPQVADHLECCRDAIQLLPDALSNWRGATAIRASRAQAWAGRLPGADPRAACLDRGAPAQAAICVRSTSYGIVGIVANRAHSGSGACI